MAGYKMKDIAKMADVSIATVGRVIHQNGYVSVENRKRIEKILQETGYVPNKIASGLKKRESKLIGHMMLFNSNMLYEKISSAINQAATKEGYHILAMTAHINADEERQQVDQLIGQQVDGVIITSNSRIDEKLVSKIVNAGVAVVMVERTLSLPKVDRIIVDDFKGALDATSHMIKKGLRRIGYIGLTSGHEVEAARYQGYCSALEESDITYDESLIHITSRYSVEAGKIAALDLLGHEDRPEGIFVTSDLYACGMLQACYELGIKVPEDLSIVGYDDTLSSMLAPPISSMALPEEEIGQAAIRLLTRRINDIEASEEAVMIEPFLVDRRTVSHQ